MKYTIIDSTDGKHVGSTINGLEIGIKILFPDGMEFEIVKIQYLDNQVIIGDSNYVCTLERSED